MARPTKCDEVLTALVVRRILAGAPANVAQQAEGVTPSTQSEWAGKARSGQEPYRTFTEAVAQARAQFIAARTANIVNAGFVAGEDGGGDWKADAFLAERLDPENFAPSQTLLVKAQDQAAADVLSTARECLPPEWYAVLVARLSGIDTDAGDEATTH